MDTDLNIGRNPFYSLYLFLVAARTSHVSSYLRATTTVYIPTPRTDLSTLEEQSKLRMWITGHFLHNPSGTSKLPDLKASLGGEEAYSRCAGCCRPGKWRLIGLPGAGKACLPPPRFRFVGLLLRIPPMPAWLFPHNRQQSHCEYYH